MHVDVLKYSPLIGLVVFRFEPSQGLVTFISYPPFLSPSAASGLPWAVRIASLGCDALVTGKSHASYADTVCVWWDHGIFSSWPWSCVRSTFSCDCDVRTVFRVATFYVLGLPVCSDGKPCVELRATSACKFCRMHLLSPFEHMVKQDHMTGEVSKFTHYLQFITLKVWGRHFFGLVFFLWSIIFFRLFCFLVGHVMVIRRVICAARTR